MKHQIPLRELVHDILPRLQATERLVNNTLVSLIAASRDPDTRARRQQQKEAFALELYRIRLNLNPLLEQNGRAIRSVQGKTDAPEGATVVTLDEHQQEALKAVDQLYSQVQYLSRGKAS